MAPPDLPLQCTGHPIIRVALTPDYLILQIPVTHNGSPAEMLYFSQLFVLRLSH